MLTWNGRPIQPDHMPAWLRAEYESEQKRIDAMEWRIQLFEIRALPEANVVDWPTEPGEFLQ